MKLTLLQMVTKILSALESDEVNSINDTVESTQVVEILEDVYNDLAVELDVPEHETLFQLIATTDSLIPCVMTVPSTISSVANIKYDNKTATETIANYLKVDYVPFDEFLTRSQGLRNNTTGVAVQSVAMNSETFAFMYWTDRHPTIFTIADDDIIIFDAIDLTVDTTLQKSKTMCQGVGIPAFSKVDTFVPDLDATQFPLYLNRAKLRAFAEIKQVRNDEAGEAARKQKLAIQNKKQKTPTDTRFDRVPKYGR